MERGMSSLLKVMEGWDATDQPGEFLKAVGMHIVGSVGGSSGALYGTMFLRMARVVREAPTVSDEEVVAAFAGAAQGIIDRGKVKPGDKTMLDALAPAVEALRQALADGESRSSALLAASAAADAGRDATADMVARRGKSSYARERCWSARQLRTSEGGGTGRTGVSSRLDIPAESWKSSDHLISR